MQRTQQLGEDDVAEEVKPDAELEDEPEVFLGKEDAGDAVEQERARYNYRRIVGAGIVLAVIAGFCCIVYAATGSQAKSEQTVIRKQIRQQTKVVDGLAGAAEAEREAELKKLREQAAEEDKGLDPSALTATAQPCPFKDCSPADSPDEPAPGEVGHVSRNGLPLGAYAANTSPGYDPGTHARVCKDGSCKVAGAEDDDSVVIPWTLTPPKQDQQNSPQPVGMPQNVAGASDQLAGMQNTINALKAMKAAQEAANGGQTGDDVKENFVDNSGIAADISGERDQAPCEVGAGEPIHVSVDQATNSDLPAKGIIHAIVTKDVMCGPHHEFVAIPQGSTFSGSMDARVVYGQDRQLLCMNRLKRPPTSSHPNGTKMDVGCLVAADVTGQVGMPAEVNNHWAALITGALVSALMGTGPSLVAGNQQGYASTIPQQLAASAGQNMNQVGQRVMQRELQRKPTLETQMLEFALVFPNRDIVLQPWDDAAVATKKKRGNKYAGLQW